MASFVRIAVLLCVLSACSAPSPAPLPSATPTPEPPVSAPPATRQARSDCAQAGPRDFDGDGHDDLAIGYLGTTGQVHVLSAGRVIRLPTPPGNRMRGFGWTVTMAKVDADRCADLVVGSRTHDVAGKKAAGAVHILYGGAARPPARLVSPAPREDAAFGQSVAVHGDLMAIGAPKEKPGGAVYLFSKGTFLRRITQDTRGVPGAAESADHFGDRLAMGPLAGGGVGLMIGATGERRDGPGRQDDDGMDDQAPLGAVTVLRDVTAARLTGVRLPPPRGDDGAPCQGFGDSLAYLPHTGLAAFSPSCGLLRFYDLGLKPLRDVTSLPRWEAGLAAAPDGRLAALWTLTDPGLRLFSPKSPAQDRALPGAHLRDARDGMLSFHGARIAVGLDGRADVALVDPATGMAELVRTATDGLAAKSVAG
ncbi:hypothetical protein ACIBEJ_06885 [Nonomuraea sp. NPDC050790]|uniref:hypothetical protein n=1 Tax=Nonomuraea sp. NPDC050790 TaxID=3364371 RepID=UPI0037B28E96